MVTWKKLANEIGNACYLSSVEHKSVKDARKDEQWISAMQDVLQQFERNEAWTLVPHPLGVNIIDDIVFGSTWDVHCHSFFQLMIKEIEMSMVGEVSYFLGLKIKQLDNGILLSQSKFAKNMLKKFGLENAKRARTPMDNTTKLIRDEIGKKVDATLYRSMIGNLLYITAGRPNICFSVGVYARSQSVPTELHLIGVKRILKYLTGTTDFGLWYSCDTNLSSVSFSDSDWAGNLDDQKSTSGDCFYVGNNLVSWHSKKKNSIFCAIMAFVWSRVHCVMKLLHSNSLDETNFARLWPLS
ncbi:uncharacterized mitochondrial protein AtMg00810-like [Humulus lupulus]|uniref:uncharacterized mitochondrial protein AtMg00810-like n=1 Tax=Humulus lupulus TaxID=3486 RepID=UPI002B409CAF|nr:uncharacterized mitochondrial protein AtMg00810-like [Humulus lupulus]